MPPIVFRHGDGVVAVGLRVVQSLLEKLSWSVVVELMLNLLMFIGLLIGLNGLVC